MDEIPKHLPTTCPYGEPFLLSMRFDVLMENLGKYDTMIWRHFPKFMRDVCFAVEMEPNIQSLQGESFKHETRGVVALRNIPSK